MRKDELRPCIVSEVHKSYFHKWIDEGISAGSESMVTSYGIVEYEDGTVHKVLPEHIKFTDRD